MDFAKALILEYTNASFVVTSRIHCGLPCLSVETPCLFILSDTLQRDAFRSSGRFEGLLDLFHVAKCTNKGIIGLTNEIKDFINIKGAGKGKITSNNIAHLSARLEYRKYKDS